ncbi:trp operon leader peptide [Streptomyces sporangiiformans]|uniref:Trp operon leader peptide n=1 Tax=Streptomyces sporangiiformans TaxID=2315329 RepID=A0A505DKE1_9ACTN|nr:trp operon leader peptide [Streptomyces sporangiiformans]
MLPALALDLAFTVTSSTLRGHVGRPAVCSSIETVSARPERKVPEPDAEKPSAPGRAWGMVRRMFAHSNQTWWWTARPAAH